MNFWMVQTGMFRRYNLFSDSGKPASLKVSFMILSNDIVPSRSFSPLYILFDSIFLVFLLTRLWIEKKKVAFFFSLAGGILYFLVDFLIFYLALMTRVITYGTTVLGPLGVSGVLFWMSRSYGITNFLLIYLALRHDKSLLKYSVIILRWWLVAPTLQEMDKSFSLITTSRGTGSYHYVMAIILLVGYALYLLYGAIKKEKRENILYLNIVGILVQLGWEASLLINGIRPRNAASVKTRIIDSLIETNLGRPYLYFIVKAISSHFNEDGKKKNLNEKPNS